MYEYLRLRVVGGVHACVRGAPRPPGDGGREAVRLRLVALSRERDEGGRVAHHTQ